jgi:hypothetical protein
MLDKAKITAKAKPILQKYGFKGTFSARNGVLRLKLSAGKLDIINNYNETIEARSWSNPLWQRATTDLTVSRHHWSESFNGEALDFMNEIWPVLMNGNWDNSDSQSDYFDVGWYCYIHIGSWNKPYEVRS